MVQVYSTHNFMYELFYNNDFEGKVVEVLGKDSKSIKIIIKDLIVKNTPVSCIIIDAENNRHIISYFRILKVFENDNLIWNSKDI